MHKPKRIVNFVEQSAFFMKDSTREFYDEIRRDFERLSNEKEFGVYKYTKEWALAKTAQRHRRSPKTVENVVFNRV